VDQDLAEYIFLILISKKISDNLYICCSYPIDYINYIENQHFKYIKDSPTETTFLENLKKVKVLKVRNLKNITF